MKNGKYIRTEGENPPQEGEEEEMRELLIFGGIAVSLYSASFAWTNLATIIGMTAIKILLGNVLIGLLGIIFGAIMINEGRKQ